ncbi:endonuclease III [Methanococcoides burtonii]|uniref:Endonuclease III n=1 Tax=Methanococcoides burtonii (strain DSM 6242 / NBRC 107633 / OCM 468 / ACE-M) TaxID=259564 RepID=Q12U43_METBU|nr:endonuclease III [Methanococcoides burtonii]ABE53033.1 Endonuclease III [Methanococcoides burtonii DSM 6242]
MNKDSPAIAMDNTANFDRIWSILKKEYPDPQPELDYSNEFELLIATILSAQCTDVQVNKVTNELFRKYTNVEALAAADLDVLEKEIYSTGFYRAKSKNIKRTSQLILSDFNGKVPDTMEELTTFPGVARKTANIVLARGFGKVEGIAVDTHVKRVSGKLGLTENTDPKKIEQDLMKLAEQKDWEDLSMTLILHGRRVCDAKKPQCIVCLLSKLCPSSLV